MLKSDRRRSPRTPLLHADAELGKIMDVSESGLCLFVKGGFKLNLGDALPLKITMEGRTVKLDTHVARITPVGIRRVEVGLSVDRSDPASRGHLEWMIKQGQMLGTSPQAFRVPAAS